MPNLIFKNYKNIGEDISKLRYLFEYAFPKEERPSFKQLLNIKQDIYAIYDIDRFIGLVVLAFHNDLCYIHFLAVSPRYQRHGYGSLILQEVFKKYDKDYRIYLFMEELGEKYPNFIERKNRSFFYLKNGFKIQDIKIDEFDVIYTMLTNNKKVTFNDHIELMNDVLPNPFKEIYKSKCKQYLG